LGLGRIRIALTADDSEKEATLLAMDDEQCAFERESTPAPGRGCDDDDPPTAPMRSYRPVIGRVLGRDGWGVDSSPLRPARLPWL